MVYVICCVCVWHEKLCTSHCFSLFSSLSLLLLFLDGTTKVFYMFHLLLLLARVTSAEHGMSCAFMPCALEINFNSGFKQLQSLKLSYLHYHNVYGYQTWQWVLTIRYSHPCESHITLSSRGLMTSRDNTTVPMATRPGRVVTYNKKLPIIKLHNPSITWFCEVMWQIRYFKFLLLYIYNTRPMITKHV